MALKPPRTTETEGGMGESQHRVEPIRPVWQGALIWLSGLVVLLAVVGFAVRAFVIPALSSTSSPSAAEAHLGQLQTQEALTPAPTPQPALAPTPVPTVAIAIAPTVAATVAPAASTSTSAPGAAQTAVPTAAPTVSPELVAEVSQAYLNYFQVSADALRRLDSSKLDAVATGEELEFLKTQIDQDRAAGRALDTSVQHSFVVVSVAGDQAQVADDYRDSSIYVDPATGQPLPGEVRPANPQSAPEAKEVYHLRRQTGPDGSTVWKVEKVDRYA